MKERLEAIVYGKVQMVMHRDFVQRKARGLKLTGEVQNLKDGTVRVLAEGEHSDLERLLQQLHHGPLLARVDSVSANWSVATGEYHSFEIKYTR